MGGVKATAQKIAIRECLQRHVKKILHRFMFSFRFNVGNLFFSFRFRCFLIVNPIINLLLGHCFKVGIASHSFRICSSDCDSLICAASPSGSSIFETITFCPYQSGRRFDCWLWREVLLFLSSSTCLSVVFFSVIYSFVVSFCMFLLSSSEELSIMSTFLSGNPARDFLGFICFFLESGFVLVGFRVL